ncbi:hypothetical protein BD413DRAFT_617430 [Trametes elegans]|nr:hypothetical protein BD413DRAFT_617430 [Trametes elegans]
MSIVDNASVPGSPRILTYKVILHCHGIHFRLYRARISHYCNYCQEIFQRSADGANDQPNSMDGFRVHDVPAKISLGDFNSSVSWRDRRRTASSSPRKPSLRRSSAPRTRAGASSPLSASARSGRATPPRCPGTPRTWRSTAARSYALPAVLKDALNEVLAAGAHWTGCALRGLREADVLCLYTARLALGGAWRAFILTPPRSDGSGASTCPGHGAAGGGMGSEFRSSGCCIHGRGARAWAWRAAIFEADEVLEKGAVDPLRYDGVPTIR